MASSSKPTAVHFSLIFFVMLSIILGVMFYINFRDLGDNEARYVKATTDLKAEQLLTRKQDEEIQVLKKVIGHPVEEVGLDDPGAGTVMNGVQADLAKVEGLAEQTYKAAIEKLLQDVVNVTQERDQVKVDLAAVNVDLRNLRRTYQTQVDVQTSARGKADKDLAGLITIKDEAIRTKQAQVDDLRASNSQLQVQLDDERTGRANDNKRAKREITDLSIIADVLREKLDSATKVSYEKPDGEIRWIDNLSGRVWINLGTADNLQKRTTFSIYMKTHQGVGRGVEDIKGSIEVTRLIDAHTAEARILEDDIYRPIAKGDPIYTPLWSPGRTENFSFVGVVDLDGDNKSDRERLHALVAGNGATIDNEVDDEGQRLRYTKFPDEFVEYEEGTVGINVNTKFLVMGRIPDPGETSKPEEKEYIEKIIKHRTDMVKEARKQGVRVVNFNDFLSYIGFKPQRRLYIPGLVERPYNLKAGAASATTNETVGNRSSSGQVSGAYGRSKRLRQPSASSGQTSKLFRGGY